jgi:hypothetical protein
MSENDGDLGVDGRTIIVLILKEEGVMVWNVFH